MKLVLIALAVIVALGAFAVILFALHPPKEWKGNRLDKMSPDDQRKHQEAMYKLHQMG